MPWVCLRITEWLEEARKDSWSTMWETICWWMRPYDHDPCMWSWSLMSPRISCGYSLRSLQSFCLWCPSANCCLCSGTLQVRLEKAPMEQQDLLCLVPNGIEGRRLCSLMFKKVLEVRDSYGTSNQEPLCPPKGIKSQKSCFMCYVVISERMHKLYCFGGR